MADPLNLAGTKLGNYRLRALLGRGTMGAVYLATDEALLRPTAVKVLTWSPADHDPEAWFLEEARSVARLNHPSVIQIYSVARHGAYCYIAMEYVEGVSADVLIDRDGPLSPMRATEIILSLAGALDLAHTSGIIHRDVKPGNILLGGDGATKLGDFGMAVSAARARGSTRAGTPHYFAPELWRGEPASPATDLYALGATYYYLLTGRPPIDGDSIDVLGAAHQHRAVPELTGAAAACMRVIRRCLAKAAADRYESARLVAWDCRSVLRELAMAAPAARPPSRERRSRGFAVEPFAASATGPGVPVYRQAPFDELHRALIDRLSAAGSTIVLTGAPGSGRSQLVRWVAATCADCAAYFDVEPGARPGSLIQRVARAFGAVASPIAGGNAEIEGLLDQLALRPGGYPIPIVLVDGVAAGTRGAAELAALARAARSTRYFSLLAAGTAELAHDAMNTASVMAVPPLTSLQVSAYIDSWLTASRLPGTPPLVVTADAALLIGHRAEGNPQRVNRLMRQLIAHGGPILTSWDAWSAREAREPADVLPARPADWPTPNVLRLINECRATAGLAVRGPR